MLALWAYTMCGNGHHASAQPRSSGRARQSGKHLFVAAGMSVTLLWELLAVAQLSAPEYVFGLQTIYPALVASVGILVGVTVGEEA